MGEAFGQWLGRTYRAFEGRVNYSIYLDSREQKVRDALDEANTIIAELTADNPKDYVSFIQRRDAIEAAYAAAMQLDTNKLKYDALLAPKTDARALRDAVTGEFDRIREQYLQRVSKIKEFLSEAEENLHQLKVFDPALEAVYRPTLEAIAPTVRDLETMNLADLNRESLLLYEMKRNPIPKENGYGFTYKTVYVGALYELMEESKVDLMYAKSLFKVNEALACASCQCAPGLQVQVVTVTAKRDTALLEATNDLKYRKLKAIDLGQLMTPALQDLFQGVPGILRGVRSAIHRLPNGGEKNAFLDRLDDLQQDFDGLAAESDIDEFKKQIAEIKAGCNQLMTDVAEFAGGDYNNQVYMDAIKARFGVSFDIKEDAMFNLKKTYEMMAKVPESHTVHESLKSIRFKTPVFDEAKGKFKAGAAYDSNFGKKIIVMNSFADDRNATYYDPITGEPAETNAFNICMLHEIGHSIDDKMDIMPGVAGPGYGDWIKENENSVLDVYKAAAMAELRAAGIGDGAGLEGAVGDVIRQGLASDRETDPSEYVKAQGRGDDPCAKPAALQNAQWAIVKKYVFKAFKVSSKLQWTLEPEEITMGDRFYVHTPNDGWYSYASSERDAITVRNYQWCSPKEWFAEVYAYCWMYDIPRPPGVGANIYPWLPQP